MDGGWRGYSSNMNNGFGNDRPKDFKKIAQTIGTDIEKILQNGKYRIKSSKLICLSILIF